MRYRRRHDRFETAGGTERVRAIEWWQVTTAVVVAPVTWRPRADVYETPQQVFVTVELPGLESDDLDVQLFQDALVVEGSRPVPELFTEGRYHAAEIPRGRFKLRLALPALIDPDLAEARFERGLLELSLPRAAEGGARDVSARARAVGGGGGRRRRAAAGEAGIDR